MLKKKWFFCMILGLMGLLFGSKISYAQEMELGSGGRKSVKVDYQRVNFGHKMHQELSLKMAGNDPEVACKICHHQKKPGKDPRACRRCHAKRQVKAEGVEMCSVGCHANAKRSDIDDKIKELPIKAARKGQLLKLKDAFHLSCKNCHEVLRSVSLDLASTKYLAPVLNCEGCHQAVDKADADAIEAEKKSEREKIGDVFPEIMEAIGGKKAKKK